MPKWFPLFFYLHSKTPILINFSFSFFLLCLARDSGVTSADGIGGGGSGNGGIGLSSSITVSPIYKSSQSLLSHQSICYAETEHTLSVNGKDSSIVLDLEPMRIQLGPCKRTFKAPEPHGFIVKLQKFKSKQMRNPNSHIDSNAGGVSIDNVYNETTTCPLNIVSTICMWFHYPAMDTSAFALLLFFVFESSFVLFYVFTTIFNRTIKKFASRSCCRSVAIVFCHQPRCTFYGCHWRWRCTAATVSAAAAESAAAVAFIYAVFILLSYCFRTTSFMCDMVCVARARASMSRYVIYSSLFIIHNLTSLSTTFMFDVFMHEYRCIYMLPLLRSIVYSSCFMQINIGWNETRSHLNKINQWWASHIVRVNDYFTQ